MLSRFIAGCVVAGIVATSAARAGAAPSKSDDPSSDQDGAKPAAPAPPPAPAPAAEGASEPAAAEAPPGPVVPLPLAGFAGDQAFLRSADERFVLFPMFRLQVDGAVFPRQTPKSGISLHSVRLEMAGWMGRSFYYDVSGDFASPPPPELQTVRPSNLAVADAYLAIAPWDDLVILQAGQFDAPFTLENRTLDSYIDFIQRSLAVRALSVPTNKEIGVMVHGTDRRRIGYYSVGVFNGDGPNFANVDNRLHIIGRAVLAPLAGVLQGSIRRAAIGASGWYGQPIEGRAPPTQTTAGGLEFMSARWTTGRDPVMVFELHPNGRLLAFAGELNLPITHTFGARAEGVFRQQFFAEDDVTEAESGVVVMNGTTARLQGIGGYGELWLWLVGDDRLLPDPGYELPLRLRQLPDRAGEEGLMVAVRGDFVKEDFTSTLPAIGDPNTATTRVVSVSAAVNYWYGRRVRLSANYVANILGGTSETIKTAAAAGSLEHELLLRFAMSL